MKFVSLITRFLFKAKPMISEGFKYFPLSFLDFADILLAYCEWLPSYMALTVVTTFTITVILLQMGKVIFPMG